MLRTIGASAILGGAAGNLVDRLRRGAVVDFIAIGPWPVFNIADASIVGGIGLVLVALR
jgi:signal peptidase II